MIDDIETSQPVISVDLDGTLAKYTHWVGHDHIGDPIGNTVILLKILREKGWKIVISTCRNNGMNGESDQLLEAIYYRIMDWLELNDIPYDEIATRSMGKPFAHVYLDDRAYRWDGDLNSAVNFCGSFHAKFNKSLEETKKRTNNV